MTIGENIKKYRKRAGLTQKELAKKCGLATGTIQQYELNKRQPRLEQINLIANILGVHPLVILGQISEPFAKKITESDIPSDLAFNGLLRAIYDHINIHQDLETGYYFYSLGTGKSTIYISDITYNNLSDAVDYFIELYIRIASQNSDSQECFQLMYELKDADLTMIKKVVEYARFLNLSKND